MTTLNLIQLIIFALTILLAVIYLTPILLIRRFHNVNNVFTVNICFASICCCTYWLFYYIVLDLYPDFLSGDQTCIGFNFFEMMCTLQVPLAAVETSVHRLCSIVYHTKLFFKKKRWAIICLLSQWATGIIFSLPRITINDPVRNLNRFSNRKTVLFTGLWYTSLEKNLYTHNDCNYSLIDLFD
jgi:hypothetical protein